MQNAVNIDQRTWTLHVIDYREDCPQEKKIVVNAANLKWWLGEDARMAKLPVTAKKMRVLSQRFDGGAMSGN